MPQKGPSPQQMLWTIGCGLAIYFAYQFTVILSMAGFKLFGVRPEIGWFLGQFMGFAAVYTLSTALMRSRLNQGKLDHPETLEMIHASFTAAELPRPKLLILKPQNPNQHNAMVTGMFASTGIASPVLLLTENIHEVLKPIELQAVIAHEISHLKLHHLFQRTLYMISSVICGMVAVSLTLFGFSALRFPGIAVMYFAAGTLGAWMVLHTTLQKRQIRRQEFEADAFAVTHLGADPAAILSAIETLSKLSGADQVERALEARKAKGLRGVLTDFMIGSTHPSLKQRRAALIALVPEAFTDLPAQETASAATEEKRAA